MSYSMHDFNFLIVVFFILLFIFFALAKSTIWMLVLSELFWILLYSSVLLIAVLTDNLQILSLSLFFLMFSAVEISTGIAILVFQLDTFNTLNVSNTVGELRHKSPLVSLY